MKSERPLSSRFSIALVLSMVCLPHTACSHSKPAMDKTQHDRAVAQAQELRTSAEAGDASAQYRLGLRYSAGNGTPQDSLHAKEWVEKAAMQGHAGAQLQLGTLYLEGNGAPQIAQMGLVWFSRAAEQEDSLAFAKVGGIYAQGRGVLQDFIQAHMWYNLGAAHGDWKAAEACDALAPQMTPRRSLKRSGSHGSGRRKANERRPTS
jgi:TPR repeat protein